MYTLRAFVFLTSLHCVQALSFATLGQRGVAGTASSAGRGTLDHYAAVDYKPNPDDEQLFASFLSLCPAPTARIFDVGFGTGDSVAAFRAAGHSVVGLDGCPKFVEIARARCPDGEGSQLLCANLHDILPEAVQAIDFDAVFACRSLFHVHRSLLPSLLYDLHDRLLPGGIFFCVNPTSTDLSDLEDWGCPGDERYAHFQTVASWAAVCEAAGFIAVEQYPWPPVDTPGGARRDASLCASEDAGGQDAEADAEGASASVDVAGLARSDSAWVTVWRRPSAVRPRGV